MNGILNYTISIDREEYPDNGGGLFTASCPELFAEASDPNPYEAARQLCLYLVELFKAKADKWEGF